ncbi:aromatic acid exporter family protein [Paenibacillus sp. GD4]|uniref:FUSC family protein n=1 Tax=Paenibacillus sp. GD4 TaxID=3068890 RepID=UPI002796D0EC|nr:aromatic acid exporter family protein [Paenibacillus sp. GD4]MDQ1912818.1 aromatic acid exporter family protein [Paenibacillus sp. GD4]
MAFGARVLKTGIAITLALFLAGLLHMTPPVIAAVAAIFAVQPSIYRSWRYMWEQVQTNVLGAVLAMTAGLLFSKDPVAIGLVCVLIIAICLKLKMEETVGLTLVTVVAVMDAAGDWHFALNRFVLIMLGLGSAFLINILFFPPNPRKQFIAQIHSVFAKMSLLLRTVISNEVKEVVFREEKEELERSIQSIADKYRLFEEETKKLKRGKVSHIRQLIVYKQMLLALQKGAAVLDAVQQHYFQAVRSPETDTLYDEHLEKLLKYHEQVLLKFEEKLKPDIRLAPSGGKENDRFIDTMIERYTANPEGKVRLAIVAAAVYDYGYHVGRLDKLVGREMKEEAAGETGEPDGT